MKYLKFLWYFGAFPGTKRAAGRVKRVLSELRDLHGHWVAYHQELVKDRNEKVAKDILATIKGFDRMIGQRTIIARRYGHKV